MKNKECHILYYEFTSRCVTLIKMACNVHENYVGVKSKVARFVFFFIEK